MRRFEKPNKYIIISPLIKIKYYFILNMFPNKFEKLKNGKNDNNLDTIGKRKSFIDQLLKKDPVTDIILFNINFDEKNDEQFNDIIFPPIFKVENIDESYKEIYLSVFLIYKIKNDPSEHNLFDFENYDILNENDNFFDYPLDQIVLNIKYNHKLDTFNITNLNHGGLMWEMDELIENSKEIIFKGIVEDTIINLKKIKFEDLTIFNQKILKNSNFNNFINSLDKKHVKFFLKYYNFEVRRPNFWGPVTWRALHMLTFKIKATKFKEKQNELFDIIIKICASLPCQDCSFHASHLIKKYKIENMNEKKKLILYMFNLHNSVNKKVGKNILSYKEFINIYKNLSFKDTIQEYYLNLWILFSTEPFLRISLINKFKNFIKNNVDCFIL